MNLNYTIVEKETFLRKNSAIQFIDRKIGF